MKQYSIGYRLKFDYINPEDIETFISNYQKYFCRYEIKVTKNLISSGKIQLLLDVSEKMAKGKYSLHVSKDVLNNSESYSLLVDLIKILRKFEVSNEVYLVTHIPSENPSNYLPKVLEISKFLPPNYVLLLENIVLESNNEEYLKQINDMCCTLEVDNIRNVGICLDIGHLLFSFSRENISEENAIFQLKNMTQVLSKVKEIHIHDYSETDHLQLKDGLMNLKLISNFIKQNELNVPIIIEVTVNNPKGDGMKQIKVLEETFYTT